MQSVFRWPYRIMCHERKTLLKLNFFQLMVRHRSWGSVLKSIYRIDGHDLQNGNAHARKRWKNTLYSSMNSASNKSEHRVQEVCCTQSNILLQNYRGFSWVFCSCLSLSSSMRLIFFASTGLYKGLCTLFQLFFLFHPMQHTSTEYTGFSWVLPSPLSLQFFAHV